MHEPTHKLMVLHAILMSTIPSLIYELYSRALFITAMVMTRMTVPDYISAWEYVLSRRTREKYSLETHADASNCCILTTITDRNVDAYDRKSN